MPPSMPASRPTPHAGPAPWRAAALAAMLALAACGQGDDGSASGISLSFEAVEAPDVFSLEGPGRRTGPDGAEGLWAVVAGLRRPESAVVRNLDNGQEVTVALFAGRPGGGAAVVLSAEAADALGIGAAPVAVRVTAIRKEPVVRAP